MGEVIGFPRHRYHSCKSSICEFCREGAKLCNDCFGVNNSLPRDCPKSVMTGDQIDMVAAGIVDFRVGQGWVWTAGLEGFASGSSLEGLDNS